MFGIASHKNVARMRIAVNIAIYKDHLTVENTKLVGDLKYSHNHDQKYQQSLETLENKLGNNWPHMAAVFQIREGSPVS